MENYTRNMLLFHLCTWQEVWFPNQMFREEVYNKLKDSISMLHCSGAMKCFTTQWNLNKSILDVTHTNICAEKAIKLMEELQNKCKTDKYPSLSLLQLINFECVYCFLFLIKFVYIYRIY